VSVRVGTALQVTLPHAWQMCSATAGMLGELPDPAQRRRATPGIAHPAVSQFVQFARALHPQDAGLRPGRRRRVRVPEPWADDGICGTCGHTLPAAANRLGR
jgi:hypothetical protein